MQKINNKTIEYLKELEQIELKRSKRYKPWEEKYKNHLIYARKIKGGKDYGRRKTKRMYRGII